MAKIRILINDKSNIVFFNYLYSQFQHLGWPRSTKSKKNVILVFTTKDLIYKNLKILNIIKNHVDFVIQEVNKDSKSIIPD
tara:strand:+ start:515 stop:757 length:243 start_codon:yes stop_codon:yes gene_type:complete